MYTNLVSENLSENNTSADNINPKIDIINKAFILILTSVYPAPYTTPESEYSKLHLEKRIPKLNKINIIEKLIIDCFFKIVFSLNS